MCSSCLKYSCLFVYGKLQMFWIAIFILGLSEGFPYVGVVGGDAYLNWTITNSLPYQLRYIRNADRNLTLIVFYPGAILPSFISDKRITYTGNLSLDIVSFTLSNITQSDAGKYEFTRSNLDLGSQALVIAENPIITGITTSFASVVAGRDQKLNCSAESKSIPPGYNLTMFSDWKRNGGNITPGFKYNVAGTILTIINVTREESGDRYTCIAYEHQRKKSDESGEFSLIVLYGPGDSVNLGSNPTTIVNLHQRAQDLTCNATCNPLCDYRWYHNRTLYSSGATLSLGVVENKTSGGNYTCEAFNKVFGLDQSSSTSINISVYYGAEIVSLLVQDSNTVNENSSAIFQCQVDSNPLPTVIWKKEGTNTVLKTESGVVQSQYRIESAQCQDTDNYTCSAYNQIRTQANRTLQFFVKCHPRTDSEVPLETKVYKKLHEAAFLRYTVISYRLPKFTWIFLGNGSESRGLPGSASPYVNGLQSELRFTSLNIDDFGNYFVMADNSLPPSAREVFEIIKADVPEVPSNITIMEVTINSVIVQWVAGYNGGTRQTFHILASAGGLTRNVTASDPGYRNKGTVVIKDLAASTNYSISMSASNSIGTSNMTEVIFVITLEEPSSLEVGTSNGIGVGGAVGIGVGGVVLGFIAAIIAFTIRRKLNGPENSCFRSKGKTDDEMHTYSNTETNPQTVKPIYEDLNKVNTERSVYDKISPL